MRSTFVSRVALTIAAGAAVAGGATPATGPASTRPAASQPTSQPAAGAHDPRAICAAHMRQLMVAAELAANLTPGGRFPADLRAIFVELQDDGALEPALVLCPVDRTTKLPKQWTTLSKEDQVAWAVAHTSYTWTGGGIDSLAAMKAGVGDQVIVLAERPRDHTNRGGGMNVGFADGTVAFIANADLPAAAKRSDAARAKLK